jgi:hypothetical protein
MMKVVRAFVPLLLVQGILCGQDSRPFLSNLTATKSSALYTTYAAQMERSEFTLDEGYHFLFYDTTRGADFVTDNAGDWSLGFQQGSRYVNTIRDLYREPVITTSYTDVVKYFYYPFKGIRADVTFLVYSSHMAIQDVRVTNEGESAASLELLPFLRNPNRSFSDVDVIKDNNAVSFTHEEFPDRWVLEHGVPFVERVHDLFMMSQSPDRIGSFQSYRWGKVEIPQQIDVRKPQRFLVGGRILHSDGQSCQHRPPVVKTTVFLNDDKSGILTENAPRWGSVEGGASSYGIELGNFGKLKAGDRFTVLVSCGEKNEDVVISGIVGDTTRSKEQRLNVRLATSTLPKAPEGVGRDIWGSGTELRLYWKKGAEGARYNVYRRDYLAGGVYELIAPNLEQLFYTDKNLPDNKVYGYVVTTIDAQGRMGTHSDEVNNIEGGDFLTDVKYPGQVKAGAKQLSRVIAMAEAFVLAPGKSESIRIVRAVRRATEDQDTLMVRCKTLMTEDLENYVRYNEQLYGRIPKFTSNDPNQEMMYWSSFSLMRQQMLPPEGKSSFNYYVFSREPQWGWGHGGQVFHESLSMLAYAMMDPLSAMNSQRVYRERQHKDGYINYRTGGYLDETIPANGQLTTSAPWYAWQNWELYKLTKEREFLGELYQSSKAFHNYYVQHRDSDADGLCEWGADAVLESVRDDKVAVWDQVGDPSNFEAVDLNTMLTMEEKALSEMARELGLKDESADWRQMADLRAKKINEMMWDSTTGFYYNVDKKNHTFTFKQPDDLKREEIIGFLPLWAGIASPEQARILVAKLTDSKKFWRTYGVPSLSADDPYYNPIGYWNGPVWVQWNYLIERGLLGYGYKSQARELVSRVAINMAAQLKKDHNFWEFYSPDDQWAGYHKTYIWAGIIARMMRDLQEQ